MHSQISRGLNKGAILRPHRHADGFFVASRTRYARDYIRVRSETELALLTAAGFSARMSAPGIGPSLICPASISRGSP
jgi:hypothetical protein